MKLKDLSNDLLKQTDERVKRKLDILASTNPRYKTLDDGDKKIILDLLDKYQERMRKGIEITDRMIKEDRLKLYGNRLSMGLTEVDLDQIYDLLESFKN
jgi:TRAP-type C4-dicarboxylate transport system substrate-binding protein